MKLVQSGKRVSHKAWSFGFYILYKIQGRLNLILKLDQQGWKSTRTQPHSQGLQEKSSRRKHKNFSLALPLIERTLDPNPRIGLSSAGKSATGSTSQGQIGFLVLWSPCPCFGVGPSSNELNLDRTSLRSKRRNAKEVAGVSPTHSSPLRSKPKKGRATFATPSACHSSAGLRPYSRAKPDLMLVKKTFFQVADLAFKLISLTQLSR